jgi:hypothetical protein
MTFGLKRSHFFVSHGKLDHNWENLYFPSLFYKILKYLAEWVGFWVLSGYIVTVSINPNLSNILKQNTSLVQKVYFIQKTLLDYISK